MRRSASALLLTAIAAAAIAAAAGSVSAEDDGKGKAETILRDKDGVAIGEVRFRTKGDVTRVRVSVRDATRGFHGFHVHSTGLCESGKGFTTAGGHYAGDGGAHGDHDGDMPPLLVSGDGSAAAEFVTDRFTTDDLLDADGSAVILHAGPDNLANIPDRYRSSQSSSPGPDAATLAAGDAGARYACGVIEGKGSDRDRDD